MGDDQGTFHSSKSRGTLLKDAELFYATSWRRSAASKDGELQGGSAPQSMFRSKVAISGLFCNYLLVSVTYPQFVGRTSSANLAFDSDEAI